MRGTRVLQWIISFTTSLSLVLALPAPAFPSLRAFLLAGDRSLGVMVTLGVLLIPTVAAVCFALWLLVSLPRFVARQGVEVNEHGFAVVKRPMWWSRGHTAFIPWQDVYHITRGVGTGTRSVLEVLLHRVDHTQPMPGWAKLVPPGKTAWGRTSSRPRVLLATGRQIQGSLEYALHNVRPDLFEAPSSGQYVAGGSIESRWVDLRRRRVPLWIVTILVAVAMTVALLVRMVEEVGKPYIGASEITGGVVFLLASLIVTVWAVYAAPRVFTRQGVAVDTAGLTLAQEPKLWFTGRTTRIPWQEVRTIGENVIVTGSSENPRRHAIVELLLHHPDRTTRVPTWASVTPRETGVAPASPTAPLTRITIKPGNRLQRRIVEALRAVRPDLFPGA